MADAPSIRRPRAIAAALREASPDAAADLVVPLDPRIARMALVAFNAEVAEDYLHAGERQAQDNLGRLLLMLRAGIYDNAITSDERPSFAVGVDERVSVQRVAAARLAELVAKGAR